MIPTGQLVGAGMQQPFLIGQTATTNLIRHLQGKAVTQEERLPVLAVSRENIDKLLPTIRRNVLGIDTN